MRKKREPLKIGDAVQFRLSARADRTTGRIREIRDDGKIVVQRDDGKPDVVRSATFLERA